MKPFISSFFLLIAIYSYAQTTTVEATIRTKDFEPGLGKAMIFSLSDSTLIKGEYIDSSNLRMEFNAKGIEHFFLRISMPGHSDTSFIFNTAENPVKLGEISLVQDQLLDEVVVSFTKPMFERTMDGISVNVDGTTLQQLNTLFDVLKASPRITSPDDEAIEIIGKGSPLILVDKQAIISNEELKAIPASQVDRIEIITSPSAKYKAQGSGSGVIEVYTKNYSMEGYRAWISTDGGATTQKKPATALGIGINYKRKKFTINGMVNADYTERNSYGGNEANTIDSSGRRQTGNYVSNNKGIWEYYNLKGSYRIKDNQKINMGFNGNGSTGTYTNDSYGAYYLNDTLLTERNSSSHYQNTWLNNNGFVNYIWDTDTLGSYLEVNLNYVKRVNNGSEETRSDFTDRIEDLNSVYRVKSTSKDHPNIGELRVNYLHNFDTSGWKLESGLSYSFLLNGKKFDWYSFSEEQNLWELNPEYANSYDYTEHISALYSEVSKKWDKFGFKAGIRGEYTQLKGYSNALEKDIIDSAYLLPFPTVSVMFSPNDTIGFKLYYNSGIERPQFTNYDPFVRIEDSLSISYGNPYLKPSYVHNVGLEVDLFYAYNLSINYSYTDNPESRLSFVREGSFLVEETPWNADYSEGLSFGLNLPIELKWLQGWNSIWLDYTKYHFTEEFHRDPYQNTTYGMYSYLNFILPHKFTITNRLNIYRWGDSDVLSKVQHNWGIRVSRKFMDNDLQVYLDVSNILPSKFRNENISGNYRNIYHGQYQFTGFKLGLYYKFGRLKVAANVEESLSGQSNRL